MELGSPPPQDFTGTGLALASAAPGRGPYLPTFSRGLGSPPATSALGLGSHLPASALGLGLQYDSAITAESNFENIGNAMLLLYQALKL